VLNHEARGAGGGPMTFRMSSPNSELIEVLAKAPGVFADSSSEATFEALPNDSDFTPFQQGGLYGYDTAIMADCAYYHSPNDDPAHLSAASLQQMGDITLAMTASWKVWTWPRSDAAGRRSSPPCLGACSGIRRAWRFRSRLVCWSSQPCWCGCCGGEVR